MNYITNDLGKQVPASGAPGSYARVEAMFPFFIMTYKGRGMTRAERRQAIGRFVLPENPLTDLEIDYLLDLTASAD
jgi:hypothetical protein